MVLFTHAVVGAALASFLPSQPAAAFAIGFASHYALDAIPHRDYPIRSRSVDPQIGAPMVFDGALVRDVLTIGCDGLAGVVVAILLFGSATSLWAISLGAVGGILPDPLQFAYSRFPHEPLRSLQQFHRWAHSDREIESPIFAIGTQAVLVAAVIGVTIVLHSDSLTIQWP